MPDLYQIVQSVRLGSFSFSCVPIWPAHSLTGEKLKVIKAAVLSQNRSCKWGLSCQAFRERSSIPQICDSWPPGSVIQAQQRAGGYAVSSGAKFSEREPWRSQLLSQLSDRRKGDPFSMWFVFFNAILAWKAAGNDHVSVILSSCLLDLVFLLVNITFSLRLGGGGKAEWWSKLSGIPLLCGFAHMSLPCYSPSLSWLPAI